MADFFDLDSLLAQLILALGAALVAGNAYALVMARRGIRPKNAAGDLRKGRAWFLLVVGLVIAIWGLASLISGLTAVASVRLAGVVQWQNTSFPSSIRGFDSLHPLQEGTRHQAPGISRGSISSPAPGVPPVSRLTLPFGTCQ